MSTSNGFGRVYRRSKDEQKACMAECTTEAGTERSKKEEGPKRSKRPERPERPERSKRSEKSKGSKRDGVRKCCTEECGPVSMHMIDVHERDRGTVCRRVAAYYASKATARGYAGDKEGARRAFRKFLAFSAFL